MQTLCVQEFAHGQTSGSSFVITAEGVLVSDSRHLVLSVNVFP